ncbi:MAG: hypothetical protein WAN87_10220 [Thermoplasmata archaeon]
MVSEMPTGMSGSQRPPPKEVELDLDEETVWHGTESSTGSLSRMWWPTFFLLLGFVTAVLGFTVLLASNNFASSAVAWISWPNAPELFIVGLGGACILVGGMLLLLNLGASDSVDYLA